jgi:hypothetical protein
LHCFSSRNRTGDCTVPCPLHPLHRVTLMRRVPLHSLQFLGSTPGLLKQAKHKSLSLWWGLPEHLVQVSVMSLVLHPLYQPLPPHCRQSWGWTGLLSDEPELRLLPAELPDPLPVVATLVLLPPDLPLLLWEDISRGCSAHCQSALIKKL